MLDGIKTIKGRFFIGLVLVMVYVSKIIYDVLMDLGIYLEYDFYAPIQPYTLLLIISLFANVVGILVLLHVLSKIIKADVKHVRRRIILFLRIGVVIVILPTGYYISYRLGFLWYCNFYITFLVGRVFNYFYLIGIVFLVSSFILFLRKN